MNCRVLVVVVAFYSIANIFSVFFLSIFLYLFYFTWRHRMQFFPQFLRLSTLLAFFNMFSKLHVKLSPFSSQLPLYSSLWLPIYCAVASPGADNFPRCHKNSKVCAMCAVYFRCKYLGFAQAGQGGREGDVGVDSRSIVAV